MIKLSIKSSKVFQTVDSSVNLILYARRRFKRSNMTDWQGHYQELIRDIPRIAATSPLMLFGLSACVDARVFAHELDPLFASGVPQSVAFGEMVQHRARRRIGGEVRIDWPEGPTFLAKHVPITYALGGTGPQAAWSLAAIGAPAVIALEDRSAPKLKQVHPDILIAE